MANKVVTLYIDDSNIRLLVTKGKQIKKLATLPLEPGLVEGAVVMEEAEVAARLKSFLKEKKVRAKKVIIGLSGLHCLTRPLTLPRLSRALLAEAVMREVKRVMPLSSEQYYIMWHTIPSPPTKTQVFVTAVRCRSADSMLKTLRLAGLKAPTMDVKPLALTRLAKEPTAFILDVQPTEFDIVIMVDRVPQPIRTVSFPGDARSWEEKLALIKADLDRTIEFYNSNNPEKPLTPDIPVYVSGELADHPGIGEPLSSGLEYPLLSLSPPTASAKDKGFYNYMVNIGLALLEPALGKMAGPSVANSNNLPAVYHPKPISLIKTVALPSVATIVALLIPMIILAQSTSANIASLHTQLDTTNRLIVQEQKRKNELKQKLTQAQTELKTFSTALAIIDKEEKEVNGNLDITVASLPDKTRLRGINQVKDSLTIKGTAAGEAEILAYARNLEGSKRFAEVVIASIQSIESGELDFTLIMKAKG